MFAFHLYEIMLISLLLEHANAGRCNVKIPDEVNELLRAASSNCMNDTKSPNRKQSGFLQGGDGDSYSQTSQDRYRNSMTYDRGTRYKRQNYGGNNPTVGYRVQSEDIPFTQDDHYGRGDYDTSRMSSSGRHDGYYDTNEERTDSCHTHCVYEELGLTGPNELPDLEKMTHLIDNIIRNDRIKAILKPAIEECSNMHLHGRKGSSNKCSIANQLTSCFGRRAKENCERTNFPTPK